MKYTHIDTYLSYLISTKKFSLPYPWFTTDTIQIQDPMGIYDFVDRVSDNKNT